jgi:hypothetical protein
MPAAVAEEVEREKLQVRLRGPQHRALDDAFREARENGRTDATALTSWVKTWIVEAAQREAAGGGPATPKDPIYRQALAVLEDRYPTGDQTAIVRMAVVTIARMVEAGQDPFIALGPTPGPPSREPKGGARR